MYYITGLVNPYSPPVSHGIDQEHNDPVYPRVEWQYEIESTGKHETKSKFY